MIIRESGLYSLIAGVICILVVIFTIIFKGYNDKWMIISNIFFVFVGITCLFCSLKKNGKILIAIDQNIIIIDGKEYNIDDIKKVSTNYRGFNSDSPKELFFTTVKGSIVKVDVSYVRSSPFNICKRINEYLTTYHYR
jgi:hypothetical protein